jgi:hypothetical protein
LVNISKYKYCVFLTNDTYRKLTVYSKQMKLSFLQPNIKLPRERNSKLLDPNSELYKYIQNIKTILRNSGFDHKDRMDLHVEVMKSTEKLENRNQVFLDRVKQLEGKELSMSPRILSTMGPALVLNVGKIKDYSGKPHITIGYFPNKTLLENANLLVRNLLVSRSRNKSRSKETKSD